MEEKYDKIIKLVKKCGDTLKKIDYREESKVKEDGSLVTKYDLIIDRILTDELKQIADIPVLSEEHSEQLGDTYFVIDPIDGTHNFSRGLEFFRNNGSISRE